jgi:RHH-type proline utilization regulon transcriptional repressor/proline dehydrogenase/delta 1-pyrroline-5-carboxylate dehydrogenase
MGELLPRLKHLALLASQYNIGFNIDAEEADRLDLSLDLIHALAFDNDLAGFDGIGFVAQAYQKRCPFVIDFLIDLARRSGRKLMLRLVKGAYWDAEIKRAQADGMAGYPVYTRKVYTDISYLVCARKLLAATDVIYPQFATHNAHTLAAIYTWACQDHVDNYEFQCLHGMGEALYDQVVDPHRLDRPCRIYAPVGTHQTLLAYLVRRLLENGANSSFVNRIADDRISIDALIADPFEAAQALDGVPHPDIPLPVDLFGVQRRNSNGLDLSDEATLRQLGAAFETLGTRTWHAAPLSNGRVTAARARRIVNPADPRDMVGHVVDANDADVDAALAAAQAYAMDWQMVPPSERADRLLKAADLFEVHRFELMALAIREAGKSIPNAVAEVREAVDFLRYYAAQMHGTRNVLALGPVACISPWNFPLAIFTGQISAALAAGNVVLAKPAEQTPLISHRAVQLLHQAGIPSGALQFLPGGGNTVGARLTADARIRGVIFTGSLEVAQRINQTLAHRSAAQACDIPFIAETGGQNGMIVDSSALPEQVVQDVITSAFDSAGQRCSALRVLCLQEEIADRVLAMLRGAMHELCVGNPDRLATDIGPVIDRDAQSRLLAYIDQLKLRAGAFYQAPLPPGLPRQNFVAPTVLEISSWAELAGEVFGPVLHVIRYRRDGLPALIDAINACGYGLTLGIHSRIDETIDYIAAHAHVGNIYVNRNMIGAAVGVQPFGGEGKSGTGPKAGGPLYLLRLQRNPDTAFDGRGFQEQGTSALAALLQWADIEGYAQLSALGAHYVRTTPLGTTLRLTGVTGERNTLYFTPRGNILCAASNPAALLNQLAAVLACGGTPLLVTTSAVLVPASLPQAVQELIRWTDRIDAAHTGIHLALIEASQCPVLRPILATRDGALVPVVETTAHDAIPLWRLIAERALCVNTAAVGGNASLMSLQT